LDFILAFIDLFVHLDRHLGEILQTYGLWTYLILFVVIFAETGLVVTPFLPGDSLIFAVGMFAARGDLSVWWLLLIIGAAAVLGNISNYAIGSILGPAVLEKDTRILKRAYLEKTHHYFERYGPPTIIIARFLPIVRTFAPFVAGVGRMTYWRFTLFNFVGCIAWVTLFLFGGYFFGNIPFVRDNLSLVILGIILLSIAPTLVAVGRKALAKPRN
jgi:membrane-associated protein